MKPSTRRLIKEYTVWLKEPIEGVYIKPDPFNILLWRGVFEGPKGTPYENGVYHFEIEFPTDYPFKVSKFELQDFYHIQKNSFKNRHNLLINSNIDV